MRTYKPRPAPDREARARRAARLRDRGHSLRQIAARMGISYGTVRRDLARWDASRGQAGVTEIAPGRAAERGNSCNSRKVDQVIPASIRTERHEWTSTLITVRCGRCGHEQEAGADCRTSGCKKCGRTMRLGADASTAANVTPLRNRRSS